MLPVTIAPPQSSYSRSSPGALLVTTRGLEITRNGVCRIVKHGDSICVEGHALFVAMWPAEAQHVCDAHLSVAFLPEDRLRVCVRWRETSRAINATAVASLLAELVGKRILDQRLSESAEERGWLCKRRLSGTLGISREYLNSLIARARSCFSGLGCQDSWDVIESRPPADGAEDRTFQIRVGISSVSIR